MDLNQLLRPTLLLFVLYGPSLSLPRAGAAENNLVGLPENPYSLDVNKSCGPMCIAVLDTVLGGSAAHSYGEILNRCPPSQFGTNLEQVRDTLNSFGYHTMPFKGATLTALQSLRHPLLLHLQNSTSTTGGHFVVLLSRNATTNQFFGFNPPDYYGSIDNKWLAEQMSGLGLVVAKQELPAFDQMFSDNIRVSDWIVTVLIVTCGVFAFLWRGRANASAATQKTLAITAIFLASVVVAGCSDTLSSSADFDKTPSEPHQIDVGTVQEGATLEHTFEIRNTSAKAFRILRVVKSCSCQVVDADLSNEIVPGATTKVKINVPTLGREGQIRQAFAVQTDSQEPGLASIELMIGAYVEAKIKAVPSTVMLGNLTPGTTASARIQIKAQDKDIVSHYISASVVGSPYLSVTRLEDGLGLMVFRVDLDANSPTGQIYGEVHFAFDDKDTPLVSVAVTGQRTGLFNSLPKVVVADNSTDPSIRQNIRIFTRDKSEFEIAGFDAPPGVHVHVGDNYSPAASQEVELVIEPGDRKRISYLTIRTNRENNSTVQLPIISKVK